MPVIVREKAEKPFVPKPDDDLLVCRCEEVTKGDIREAVHAGLRTFGEVKRYSRVGMGLCQGQTCQRLVRHIIASELGIAIDGVGRVKGRAPMEPVIMKELALSRRDSKGVDDYAE
ncbi:MAG: (2Fe-2S)-binding protein [Clostridiales Family XIII bacterium]|jgi:NAD(P)H-nitrite reductase large subunit|nr:(2Fe-2S)-binding protein [Clostridiales Family XIII bacterium]